MTVDALEQDDTDIGSDEPSATSSLRTALVAIIAVAVLAIAVAAGFLWGSRTGDNAPAALPSTSSVDAGFARDMATHHQQAVTMAGYVRDNPSKEDVANVAYDIETSQSIELGQMTGWLDTWGVSRTSGTPMTWMHGMHMHLSADGLMPGMATPAQLNTLLNSHGKKMDVLFLQLMIRHHQGGVAMAQYAAQHATEDYVRTLAGHMVVNQTKEIVQMEQMLRQLGGTPLPAPDTH